MPEGDAPPVAPLVGLSLGYAAESLRDLPAALDAAEALGVGSVELFLPALGVVIGGRPHAPGVAALRGALAGRGVAVTLHGPLGGDLGAAAAPSLQRAVTRATLAVAQAVGARVVVQHATVCEPAAAACAMAREAEALAALAPEAAAAGCVIGLETMFARPGEWTPSAGEIARTLAAVDHPGVGATVDFSHAWLNATARGLDPLAEIAALAPRARHLHVHDSLGRAPAFRSWTRGDAIAFGFGDLHLPPCAGALPWADLAALDWRDPGVANLELDRRWDHVLADAVAWTADWRAGLGAAPAPRRAAADA